MANWGDYFADSFGKSYVQAAQEAFEKWKVNKEMPYKTMQIEGQVLDSIKTKMEMGIPLSEQEKGFVSSFNPAPTPQSQGGGILPSMGQPPIGNVPTSVNNIPYVAGDLNAFGVPKSYVPDPFITKQKEGGITRLGKAREDLDTWTTAASDAVGAIDKIGNYAKKLPKYESGFGNQLWAKSDAWVKEFSKDPAFTEYLGVVAQEMIPMARKLQEEKGPITEFDVARVEKGFGDKTTPLEQRVTLLKELRGKLKKAAINKMEVAKINELDFYDNYPTLYDSLFTEKALGIKKARESGKFSDKQILDFLKKIKE